MDLVIETGALLTDILGKISAACSEAVELCGKLHHILHRHCAGVGAVIAGFIFFHSADDLYPGIILPHSDFNKGIRLVILQ